MERVSAAQSIADLLRAQIKSNAVDVPLLPRVARRVIELTRAEDSDAEGLSRLIQSDQGLAGHVMRIANSALYSPHFSIVSLQQAIARLGMGTIAEIALGICVNSKIFNAPGYEALLAAQLKHSLHAGLWAKEVARACRRNVEAAFLAGLLHDIGRPVTIQAVLELARGQGLELPRGEVVAIAERYQQAVSVRVVQQWEMPAAVSEVVRWLHDYQKAGKAREQTAIVLAGELLAAVAEHQQPEAVLAQSELFPTLDLYPEDIAAIRERATVVREALEGMSA